MDLGFQFIKAIIGLFLIYTMLYGATIVMMDNLGMFDEEEDD